MGHVSNRWYSPPRGRLSLCWSHGRRRSHVRSTKLDALRTSGAELSESVASRASADSLVFSSPTTANRTFAVLSVLSSEATARGAHTIREMLSSCFMAYRALAFSRMHAPERVLDGCSTLFGRSIWVENTLRRVSH